MPRRVRERKPRRRHEVHRFRDNDEEDEMSSDDLQVTEEDSTQPTLSVVNSFDQMVELMTDQRASTRERAIRDMTLYLQRLFTPQSLDGCSQTVIENLLSSIKRGQGPEIKMALQCLCLVLATLQEVPDIFHTSIFDVLSVLAIDHRVAAARADILSVVAFIALLSGDLHQLLEVQKLMLSVIGSSVQPNDEALLAAVRAWGLLATQLSHNQLLLSGFPLLPTFSRLLQHQHGAIRSAAGENIALLCETRWAANTMGSAIESPGWQDMMQHVRDLASENNRYISKRNRLEQRVQFRAYCRTVETGFVPPVSFNIQREPIVLDSWRRIKQYDYLTMLLESGMAVHLQHNRWMRTALELEPTRESLDTHLTKLEKRRFVSKSSSTSKQRYLERSKSRGSKSMAMTGGRYFVEMDLQNGFDDV
eukprot:GILK01011775.1.p1 GENE.GILK01011775.1~~GILK01011775.1.p1  ORF type:complete len:420 (-),score=62.09 GILK01011775.1:62-1321(-)